MASEKQVKEYDKFVVRLPDGMRDALAERAKANGRSMNSEIVQIIQDVLDNPASERKNSNELFSVLMGKMALWYQQNSGIIEKISHLDDEQLRRMAEEIEKRR